MGTNQPKTIPQGYKATALGIIPQEWEAMRLSDVCTLINGRAYKQNELLSKGKYKILRVGNFFTNDSWYFSDMELDTNKYAYKGDLLYAWSASFGPRFWTGDKVIYHYHIWKICNLRGINQQYLYFFLDYDASLLQRDTQGGTMHHITKENMEKRFIPVPPIAEQRKIAEVLGVWDEAIEKQARLIEKLALRKRALMQRLLSAKLRLPGFSEPWKKVKLGDIGDTYNGLSGKNKDDFEYGNAQFIPYTNVFSNERIDTNNLGCVQIKPNEQQNTVKYGDIFFTVSSETPDEVGMASVLLEHLDNTYLNSFCFGYRLNNFSTLNPFFAAYLFRTEHFRNYMSVLAQGSTRFNISKKEVMKLKIDLPTIEEQTAIAEVLTAADREIELAKEKLERLRRQKRGLMQQLLTGKKRI